VTTIRIFLFILLACISLGCLGSPEIRIEYRDKPPYSYTQNGQARGFLIDRTRAVLSRAGLTASYIETPMKRMFANVEHNREPVCSPGRYKLAERETFAQFSLAIHKDRPHAILAASRVQAQLRRHQTLKSLFGDPELRLGLIANVSYGAELDRAIEALDYTAVNAAGSVLQLAKMVAHNHGADYMLIDREDHAFLDRAGKLSDMGLQLLEFPDIPPGLKRYLMCSKNLDAKTMVRINRSIAELFPEFNP
jgi:polar amino acid transport system substrate-binding protein